MNLAVPVPIVVVVPVPVAPAARLAAAPPGRLVPRRQGAAPPAGTSGRAGAPLGIVGNQALPDRPLEGRAARLGDLGLVG
jgi:hypothetical protein